MKKIGLLITAVGLSLAFTAAPGFAKTIRKIWTNWDRSKERIPAL